MRKIIQTTIFAFTILCVFRTDCNSQIIHFEPIDHFKEHTLTGMFYISGTDKVIYNVLYLDNSVLHENGESTELGIKLYGSVELYGTVYYQGRDGYYIFNNNTFNQVSDIQVTGYIGSPIEIGNNEIVYTSETSIIKSNVNFSQFDTLYTTGNAANLTSHSLYSCKKYEDKYIFIPGSYPGRLIFANNEFSEFDSIPISHDEYNYQIIGDDLIMLNGDRGIYRGNLKNEEFKLDRVVNQELYGGQIYNDKLIVSTGKYYHSPGTQFYYNPSDDSLQEIYEAQDKNIVLSDGRFIMYDLQIGHLAIDNNLDNTNIVYPDIAAAKFLGWTSKSDTIIAVSERNAYVLPSINEEWQNVNPKEEMYYYGINNDGIGNIYLYASGTTYRSNNGLQEYREFSNKHGHWGFNDTTLIIGHQGCSDTNFPTPSEFSSDGGINWDQMPSPPCHRLKNTTLTENRFYIYDADHTASIGPGNNYYSWFGYFDRMAKEYKMVIPPSELGFPEPQYNGAWMHTKYCFYVSPQDEYHIHPLRTTDDIYYNGDNGDSWYYNPDEGYSKTENVPTGRIYPAPDSLGTIIVQNSGTNQSPRIFQRYDHTGGYKELQVYPPNLPPIKELSYNSMGKMIIATTNGRFYIAESITTNTKNGYSNPSNIFSLYPNPASNIVNINNPNDRVISYNVLNTEGKIVLQGQSNEINTESLSSGLYLVQVFGINIIMTKKLILSK